MRCAALALPLLLAGCASSSRWFHAGPRPSELTGIWIDVEKTTAADTSAWLLGPGGDDLTLHFRVRAGSAGESTIERTQKRYGSWYVMGAVGDTAGRALCFQRRPRDGASCRSFRLDTLAGAPRRRRLTVTGYPGQHHTSERVLVERLP
jgi:hypothetical protein